MDSILFVENIIFIVTDIIAGVFLAILTLSVIMHSVRLKGQSHLIAASIMLLCSIFIRLFAGQMENLTDTIGQNNGVYVLPPISITLTWAFSLLLISTGIAESLTFVIDMNGGEHKSLWKNRLIVNGIIAAAGVILYFCTKELRAFTVDILIQFAYSLAYLKFNCSTQALREYTRATYFAIATFVIALIFDPIRLTGLGLSVMLIIFGDQYSNHIGQRLIEKETALEKNKVQLLAEQISPHYIYNSLQSISGLCSTDPARAREAVDAFSDYLRGNLESLTKDDFIPFSRELEHTRSYLELEEIAGRKINVEYSLEADDFLLPPLVLQPLVENAVKHGAGNRQGGTVITISTRDIEGAVCIDVSDRPACVEAGSLAAAKEVNDAAYKTATNGKKKQSVGLDNVRTRLEIQCGGTLMISSLSDGTKATITLPKLKN